MWSSDPQQNLRISNTANDCSGTKVRSTSDGGCFIAWYESVRGTFTVRLQRMNALGDPLWGDGGILVSNYPTMSSVGNLDMTVDAEDNAILVCCDSRTGQNTSNVYAYKISSGGEFRWSTNGIPITQGHWFNVDPVVAAGTDGSYLVGWNQNNRSGTVSVGLRKVTSKGFWGWMTVINGRDEQEGAQFVRCVPADNGGYVVAWVNHAGGSMSYDNYIFTQKYSARGETLWGNKPMVVFGLPGMPVACQPLLVADGLGGAFYAWSDFRNNASQANSYLQHILTGGAAAFPQNGAAVSTDTMLSHILPAFAYAPENGSIIVYWLNKDISSQEKQGISAQRFSQSGERLWGNDGLQLLPMTTSYLHTLRATVVAEHQNVLYFISPLFMGSPAEQIRALSIDNDGNFRWSGGTVTVSSRTGSKSDLNVIANDSGMGIAAWCNPEQMGGRDAVYAQNLNRDGSLGVYTMWRNTPMVKKMRKTVEPEAV